MVDNEWGVTHAAVAVNDCRLESADTSRLWRRLGQWPQDKAIMHQQSRRRSRSLWLALVVLTLSPQTTPLAQAPSSSPGTAMTLDVDATDAPMRILHATLSMAAGPGEMTLFYPKWIPGEHMPSGPIANLTGLHIVSGGEELPWRRDLIEVNGFRFTVPPGATSGLASSVRRISSFWPWVTS